jgi:hypothetical protein
MARRRRHGGIIGDATGMPVHQQTLMLEVDLPMLPELWKNADESQ